MITRAKILMAGTASLLLCSMPAQAQVEGDIVLNIMRECAKIGDATARLACYDNNIRSAGPAPRTSASTATPRPQQGSQTPVPANNAQGFGADSLRVPRQPETAQAVATADEISARVSAVAQREPGVYLLTLENGSQWLFNEGVSSSYSPPRSGSTVEIRRGSLGSFLLRFNNQAPVAVRRVQ